MNTKEITITVGLLLSIVTGAMGYGKVQAQVEENKKDIEYIVDKLDTRQQQMYDLMMDLKNEINRDR